MHASAASAESGDAAAAEHTHFGYQSVPADEKAGLVGEVFTSVAARYDLMNDLMSFGAHRLWKHFAAGQSGLRRGDSVLDVAAGSGDMAMRLARQVGRDGRVVLSDVNEAMLQQGRDKMIDAGFAGNIEYALGDAEDLPFAGDSFHCVCIAFGLRNVTRIEAALASMFRVLMPGGRLLVLEFSKPLLPLLAKVYDAYSFAVLPALGELVVGDARSYRYLAESIRRHPGREELRARLEGAGFEDVRVYNLSGGIVALHIGFKY